MWESAVRLVGDDEAAHKALTQLKKAIRSRVSETELPEGSQGYAVDRVVANRLTKAPDPVTPDDSHYPKVLESS